MLLQRRSWEHQIRANPTFHRYVAESFYPLGWAGVEDKLGLPQ